jgi:hypothetical protein
MSVALSEVFACDMGATWVWTHGWLDRRKFKGQLLSNHRSLDADYEVEDIIRGRVRRGWVITVAGDLSGCGWDMTTYFCKTEPLVVDGRWDGATTYDEYDGETEVPAEVVDGPHPATWLEMAENGDSAS